MEFITLKKNNTKKVLLVLVVFVAIVVTIVSLNARAKYQVTKNVQIVNGTINYVPYDFKIVKIYKEKDTGGYEETTSIPEGEYIIDEKQSKCMIDDNQQDTGAILKTIDGNHTFANLKKMDKCTLYFSKKVSAKDFIINNSNVISTQPNFAQTACDSGCESTAKGLYKTQDDDGESYYFRGSVNNNWVKFAGYYWRIIRINGDGTIRLIYSGKVSEENLTFPSTNKTDPAYVTGTGTQVTIDGSNITAFNTNYNRNRYVGYMYGSTSGDYSTSHKNETPSNIKTKLEDWYTKNLENKTIGSGSKKASDYIDTDAGFCGDRTPYSGRASSATVDYTKGGTTTTTYYGGYFRLVANKQPDLSCKRKIGSSGSTTLPDTNDLYTVSTSKKGNKAISKPVGLISADEVTFAGGRNGANNRGYYLYTNETYWTMSPRLFDGADADVFYVYSDGYLNVDRVNYAYGVRPVINLKADTKFTFTHPDQPTKGTYSNPYEVS